MSRKPTAIHEDTFLHRAIQENLVIFTYSTLSWISGIISLVFPLLNSELRIVSKEPFSPKHFAFIVKKYSVTTTMTSTEHVTRLNSPEFKAADFVSMTDFICGGERLPKLDREFLISKLPKGCFAVVYGTSECGMISTSERDIDTSKIKDNVLGRPGENVEVRIVDINSRKSLGVNENGEVLIRAPTMFCVSLTS